MGPAPLRARLRRQPDPPGAGPAGGGGRGRGESAVSRARGARPPGLGAPSVLRRPPWCPGAEGVAATPGAVDRTFANAAESAGDFVRTFSLLEDDSYS